MEVMIPSVADVALLLQALDTQGLRSLSIASGVPFTTLWKIRAGETSDPRLTTIRDLVPHLNWDRRVDHDLAQKIPHQVDRRTDLKQAKRREHGEG